MKGNTLVNWIFSLMHNNLCVKIYYIFHKLVFVQGILYIRINSSLNNAGGYAYCYNIAHSCLKSEIPNRMRGRKWKLRNIRGDSKKRYARAINKSKLLTAFCVKPENTFAFIWKGKEIVRLACLEFQQPIKCRVRTLKFAALKMSIYFRAIPYGIWPTRRV